MTPCLGSGWLLWFQARERLLPATCDTPPTVPRGGPRNLASSPLITDSAAAEQTDDECVGHPSITTLSLEPREPVQTPHSVSLCLFAAFRREFDCLTEAHQLLSPPLILDIFIEQSACFPFCCIMLSFCSLSL
jgi:hypothetical protein